MSESRSVLRHPCRLYIFKEYYPYLKKKHKKKNEQRGSNNNNISTWYYTCILNGIYYGCIILQMLAAGFGFFLRQVFIIFYDKN